MNTIKQAEVKVQSDLIPMNAQMRSKENTKPPDLPSQDR